MMSLLKRTKNMFRLLAILVVLTMFAAPVWAAGSPGSSIFDNSLAVTLIILMIILLIIIAVLASILIGAAEVKLKKTKQAAETVAASLTVIFLLSGNSLFAQNNTPAQVTTASATTIAGLSSTTFYIIASVIFLELLTILVLIFNIKSLLKTEKKKLVEARTQSVEGKRMKISWWDKINRLRPAAQEADLDMGHEYDGIRELNNRLPPWWLYGFYVSIVIAGIYLWRYHVSHSAPSSKQEFEMAVTEGDKAVEQYLKIKGDNVDENNVTQLTDAADIEAGKAIFTNPANCVPCHRADAGGVVGPNLTDDYWLYGGSIKDVFKTIKYGTEKGMKSWKDDLSAKQMAQVASYVKSLHGTHPPNPKEQQGDLYKDELTTKPAGDSLKLINDSLKVKDTKVAKN